MADPPPEDHAALPKPRKSLRPGRQTRKPLRLPRPLADLICWLRCWCGHPGDVRPRAPTHPPAQVALSSRPGALGRSGLSRPGQLPVQTPSRMYMRVETRTSSCLHLKRAPGIRSWSLLVGILSTGLAAAYYSGDSLGWKLFYVTGCLFVAVQNLEDWEEAIFNKSTGKVILKTFSLYRKLLTLLRAGHDEVVVLLNDIRDVNVEEEKVRYFGKGYMVVLRFSTGFSHPLTQSAVMGHRSDVEAIAKLITSFLELHRLESPSERSQSSDSEVDVPGSQS